MLSSSKAVNRQYIVEKHSYIHFMLSCNHMMHKGIDDNNNNNKCRAKNTFFKQQVFRRIKRSFIATCCEFFHLNTATLYTDGSFLF